MRRLVLALLIGCGLLVTLARAGALEPSPTPQGLTFRFVQDKQILLPITVNGQPAEAWLDSGASASVLDAAFARKLGVATKGRVRARGVAGRVNDVRLARVDIQAGDLAMAGRRVAVMDLSAVSRVSPRPVEVLLGRDVFDQAVVDIDFEARRITLIPRAGFMPPPGPPLRLRRSADLRSVPIVVAGVSTQAILDLGNAGGLLLDRDFVDGHRLMAGRRVTTELGVGADGPREQLKASLDGVQLGGVTFSGVTAVATPGLSSQAPANVGLQLLSRFHLTIDFAGGRLWMAPYADAASRPFRKNRTGFSLTPEHGGLIVDHVAAGSPAAAGGWTRGEVITAIDGQPIAPDYAASDAALWIYGPAGRTVTLTLADGGQRRLTLADYF